MINHWALLVVLCLQWHHHDLKLIFRWLNLPEGMPGSPFPLWQKLERALTWWMPLPWGLIFFIDDLVCLVDLLEFLLYVRCLAFDLLEMEPQRLFLTSWRPWREVVEKGLRSIAVLLIVQEVFDRFAHLACLGVDKLNGVELRLLSHLVLLLEEMMTVLSKLLDVKAH